MNDDKLAKNKIYQLIAIILSITIISYGVYGVQQGKVALPGNYSSSTHLTFYGDSVYSMLAFFISLSCIMLLPMAKHYLPSVKAQFFDQAQIIFSCLAIFLFLYSGLISLIQYNT